jgi:hypothetical protein
LILKIEEFNEYEQGQYKKKINMIIRDIYEQMIKNLEKSNPSDIEAELPKRDPVIQNQKYPIYKINVIVSSETLKNLNLNYEYLKNM